MALTDLDPTVQVRLIDLAWSLIYELRKPGVTVEQNITYVSSNLASLLDGVSRAVEQANAGN